MNSNILKAIMNLVDTPHHKLRETYQENHMDKSVIVKFNNNEDYELIKKILKITNITEEKLEKVEYNIKNKRFDVTIYYEKELTDNQKQFNLINNIPYDKIPLVTNIEALIDCPSKIPYASLAFKIPDDTMKGK